MQGNQGSAGYSTTDGVLVLSCVANIVMAGAVIFTAYTAIGELRVINEQVTATHHQKSLDTLWRLHDRLASETMHESFSALANLPKPVSSQHFMEGTSAGRALWDIANFYEMIALSVNSGYLQYEDIRNYVGMDIMEFWEGVDDAVKDLRRSQNRPKMFAELEKLAVKVAKEQGY